VILLARRTAACVVLASSTLTTGCSVVFVSGPKKSAPGRLEAAGCSTSRAAPFVDMALFGFSAGGAVSALGREEGDYRGTGSDRGTDVTVSATLAALYAASMFYGFATVATCRAVNADQPIPSQQPEDKRTRAERAAEEAAEEAAVQARANANAVAEAKAAGEAAARGPAGKEKP
jgi:hypothetical protein